MLPVPVQLRLVLVVKAQQQRVKGETFDPPAGLDGPILHVLGELQNLQPDLSVVTQTQETPQGEGQLVEHTSSAWTQEDRGGQRRTVSADVCTACLQQDSVLYLLLMFRSPLMNSRSAEYME